MYHDKKTSLKHQDILARRGFNIPEAEAVVKVKHEIAESQKDKGERTKAKAKNNKSEIKNG